MLVQVVGLSLFSLGYVLGVFAMCMLSDNEQYDDTFLRKPSSQ